MRPLLAFFALLCTASAQAETLVLEASERGMIPRRGSPELGPEAEYFTGQDLDGSVRGVVVFDLAALSGIAASATLRLWSPAFGYVSRDRFESLGVYGVASDASALTDQGSNRTTTWFDLGGGALLATRRIEAGPSRFIDIPLDSAILRVLNGAPGLVAFGLDATSARKISNLRFGPREGVFAATSGPDIPPPQLVLETTPGVSAAAPTTLHVDSKLGSQRGDGSAGNPFASIATALDLAAPGDDVVVAAGVYPDVVIMKANVDLLGSGAEKTIIDISGSITEVIAKLPSVRCADATLDGFLILQMPNGYDFSGPDHPVSYDEALDCTNETSPMISNVAIATPFSAVLLRHSRATFHNVRIRAGWGILAGESAPSVIGGSIDSTTAVSFSDPLGRVSDPVRIERNTIRGRVDALYFAHGELRVLDNLFLLPTHESASWAEENSGLRVAYSPDAGLIAGNTFVGTRGIDVAWNQPAPATSRATIVNNLLAFGTRGIWIQRFYAPPQTLLHNDVFGNFAADGVTSTNYMGVSDPTGTNGNVSVDPLLLGSAHDGFPLSELSPLLDVGTDDFAEPGEFDLDEDPRITDADADGEAVPDIGAQERPAAPSRLVRIDVAPGRPNAFRDRPSKKGVSVAILSDPGFDAPGDVDMASLAMRGFPVVTDRRGDFACEAALVDSDAAADLVCSFPFDALGGLAGLLIDRRACVSGETLGGARLSGCDSVEVRR
jgi:hypothetical protein